MKIMLNYLTLWGGQSSTGIGSVERNVDSLQVAVQGQLQSFWRGEG